MKLLENHNFEKVFLITIAMFFTIIILGFPIFTIFKFALNNGLTEYIKNVQLSEVIESLKLTLFVSLIVLPINIIFGLSASWLIAKNKIAGRTILMTIIDLPFSISPIVAGLAYLLLYGNYGYIGKYLEPYSIQLMFNIFGIVIISVFVSCPFIVRTVVPLMQHQGSSQEEASLTLGASGFYTFLRVTLPNIKWGLLYGVILANARVMGEFGAVSVVSGMIRGETITLPLAVQLLYLDNNIEAAFAAATILSILAIITLVIKNKVEKLN